MSKTSYQQRLAVLKIWIEDKKLKSNIKKKQIIWTEDND